MYGPTYLLSAVMFNLRLPSSCCTLLHMLYQSWGSLDKYILAQTAGLPCLYRGLHGPSHLLIGHLVS